MEEQLDQDLEADPIPCCPTMAGQLELSCSWHPDLVDCADAIIVRSGDGSFRFPLRDGSTSFLLANFCPWCGTRLLQASNLASKAIWAKQTAVLAEIGRELYDANISVELELPDRLASLAVDAWRLEDAGDGIADHETGPERTERHSAGSLALIGLAISDRGTPTEYGVSVALDPHLVGLAIKAADDAGLITSPPKADEQILK